VSVTTTFGGRAELKGRIKKLQKEIRRLEGNIRIAKMKMNS